MDCNVSASSLLVLTFPRDLALPKTFSICFM